MDLSDLLSKSKSSKILKPKKPILKSTKLKSIKIYSQSTRRALLNAFPLTARMNAIEMPIKNAVKPNLINSKLNSLQDSNFKSPNKYHLNSSTSRAPSKKFELTSKKPQNVLLNDSLSPKSNLSSFKINTRGNSLSKKRNALDSIKINDPIALKSKVNEISCRTQIGSVSGKSKYQNQDDFFIYTDFGSMKNQFLLGVMDGHGLFGHEVSSYIKSSFPLIFENYLSSQVSNKNSFSPTSPESLSHIQLSFKSAYTNLQKSLKNKREIDINYSGSTSISLLIRDSLCVCANVGDSRAIIGKFDEIWYAVDLSKDHKPSVKSEKVRIEGMGGRVEPYREENGEFVGPDRVWMKNEQLPGLAMSRSIGDLVAAHVGVTYEPEIIVHQFDESDKFIIIASDGVWEFLNSYSCVQIISRFYHSGDIEKACDTLMEECIALWKAEDDTIDDITFIVVFLNDN